jgi:hypothetical protein
MTVKMVRNVNLCTNSLFSRFADRPSVNWVSVVLNFKKMGPGIKGFGTLS